MRALRFSVVTLWERRAKKSNLATDKEAENSLWPKGTLNKRSKKGQLRGCPFLFWMPLNITGA